MACVLLPTYSPGRVVEHLKSESTQLNSQTTRITLQVSGSWTDCSRQSCCPGYTLILGRCVSASVDPCSIEGICEHNCDVYFGRVVCTCRSGFR